VLVGFGFPSLGADFFDVCEELNDFSRTDAN
jgi:hypothetical protein